MAQRHLLARPAALAGLGAAALGITALMVSARARKAERDNPPTGRFIDVEGVQVHYAEIGEGDPLVLLHGNGSMLQDFMASGFVKAAAKHYRVIAFDRPGYGYTERPRSTIWTPAAQAGLLRSALHRIGVSNALVLGHSWGASVAIALGLETPGDGPRPDPGERLLLRVCPRRRRLDVGAGRAASRGHPSLHRLAARSAPPVADDDPQVVQPRPGGGDVRCRSPRDGHSTFAVAGQRRGIGVDDPGRLGGPRPLRGNSRCRWPSSPAPGTGWSTWTSRPSACIARFPTAASMSRKAVATWFHHTAPHDVMAAVYAVASGA